MYDLLECAHSEGLRCSAPCSRRRNRIKILIAIRWSADRVLRQSSVNVRGEESAILEDSTDENAQSRGIPMFSAFKEILPCRGRIGCDLPDDVGVREIYVLVCNGDAVMIDGGFRGDDDCCTARWDRRTGSVF